MSMLGPAAAKGGSKGITALLKMFGIGTKPAPKGPITPTTYTSRIKSPGTSATISGGFPRISTPPAPTEGFRGAISEGLARKQARVAAKNLAKGLDENAVQRPVFQRLAANITSRPGRSALIASPFAAIAGGLGKELFEPAQPDIQYSQLKSPSDRERYLTQVKELGEQAYNLDPTLQLQLANQARVFAEQAAAGYERIGRPELAEAARQNIMNQYNELSLANKLQGAREQQQLLAKAQKDAAEYSGAITSPSQIRELAAPIASEYFALPQEDKDFYAAQGYDTPEKYVQGRINGEI